MFDFIRNVIRGQTIYRILFQKVLCRHKKYIVGRILDLGAGSDPSYYRYLDTSGREFIKTDYVRKSSVGMVVDFNEPLSFPDSSFDTVCMFHCLYIAEDPKKTLLEVHRILKPGGAIVLSMPFVANEMPEPHDFHRYTLEGLDVLIGQTSFDPIVRERIGERFTAATYVLNPILFIWPLKLVIYSLALLFDKLIPGKLRRNYPFPIGYLYVARKV